MILSGLPNFGATCYLNSTIQCLNATPTLYEYLAARLSKFKPDGVTVAVYNLFSSMREGNPAQTHKRLMEFFEKFNAENKHFVINTQQDSQEFYIRLLDTMDKEISATYNQHSAHKSIIKQLFDIEQNTRVKCHRCKTIVNTKSISRYIYVNKSMEYYREEHLTGSNKYFCDHCKSLQDATKQITILSTPKILVLMLAKYEDITMHMNISSELNYNKKIYNPYGIITHSGSLHGGHYISQCRFDKSWYLFNDNSIHHINNDYTSVGAFMVFYVEKSE
jgi:ubiquitin C-terminal hydrolase